MVPRKTNIRESIDFTPHHHRLLKFIAKHLRITLPGAVEYALEYGLVHLARGTLFFDKRIEAVPGSRLAHEDLWAAFLEWSGSRGFQEQMSAHDFAAMGHLICHCKQIAVRVHGNQVFCLDVRLRG
jgi:hypothetical protein